MLPARALSVAGTEWAGEGVTILSTQIAARDERRPHEARWSAPVALAVWSLVSAVAWLGLWRLVEAVF